MKNLQPMLIWQDENQQPFLYNQDYALVAIAVPVKHHCKWISLTNADVKNYCVKSLSWEAQKDYSINCSLHFRDKNNTVYRNVRNYKSKIILLKKYYENTAITKASERPEIKAYSLAKSKFGHSDGCCFDQSSCTKLATSSGNLTISWLSPLKNFPSSLFVEEYLKYCKKKEQVWRVKIIKFPTKGRKITK